MKNSSKTCLKPAPIIRLYGVSVRKGLFIAAFPIVKNHTAKSCLPTWPPLLSLTDIGKHYNIQTLKDELSHLGNTLRINVQYLSKDFYSAFVEFEDDLSAALLIIVSLDLLRC